MTASINEVENLERVASGLGAWASINISSIREMQRLARSSGEIEIGVDTHGKWTFKVNVMHSGDWGTSITVELSIEDGRIAVFELKFLDVDFEADHLGCSYCRIWHRATYNPQTHEFNLRPEVRPKL